jgi:hypothetical protein
MNGLPPRLPKMMIGFVVRRCIVELGHRPSPAEFAAWANRENEVHQMHCVFGRPISEDEARLILKHQARLVTARSAAADEQWREQEEASGSVTPPRAPGHTSNVVAFPGPGRTLRGALRRRS